MSASSDGGFIALRVVVSHDVRDPERFARAVLRLHEETRLPPDRLTCSLWKTMTRSFKPSLFVETVSIPEVRRIQVWTLGSEGIESTIHLRDDPAAAEFIDRATAVVIPGLQHLDAVLELVRAIDDDFGIVGGGITGHATRMYAAKECRHRAVDGEWDPATVERIEWDAWKWRKTRTKLTRLNPITIIGPSIWAQLPPMPAFDPAPVVEDLGAVKLLRAWPTLCPPRDPAFLRGTRALREWLWPYTIQNPADSFDKDPPG